jgi:hypothetical protein
MAGLHAVGKKWMRVNPDFDAPRIHFHMAVTSRATFAVDLQHQPRDPTCCAYKVWNH